MLIRNTSNFYHNLHRSSRAPRCLRAFFTLPDLSSLSPFSESSDHEPQTYHERKIFPCASFWLFLVLSLHLREPSYEAQQLYNVVADVASYPSFLPFCTGSRIISKTRHEDSSSSTESMDAELTVGFLSLKESYVSRVTCKPFASVEVSASGP
jgi:coenzyme Q-binding protein COQ10